MKTLEILILLLIFILLLWNVIHFIRHRNNHNKDRDYFELNSRLNFITAAGSLFILLGSFLGWNVKEEILKKSEVPIAEMIKIKSHEIDSLLENKNILKAGIYIVNDIEFKEDKIIKFEDLKTIDNKKLPTFERTPKLIISTNTGENLRIKEITKKYFILSKPVSKNFSIGIEGDNPEYPSKVKFDLWIADYEPK